MPQRRRGERVLGPYHDPRRGWVVIHVQADGTRTTSACKSEKEAAAVKRDLEGELHDSVPTTIEEAMEFYLAWSQESKARPIKPQSAEARRVSLRAYFLPDLQRSLQALTPRRCKALYEELVARPVTRDRGRLGKVETPRRAASHRQSLIDARSMLRWCVTRTWIAANPAETVEPRGVVSEGKQQLTIDEAMRLLRHCLDVGTPAGIQVAFLYLFGLRPGETRILQVRHLSLTAWVIEVPPFKCRKKILALDVPDLPELRAALTQLVKGRFGLEPLFGVAHNSAIRKRMEVILAELGLPQVCPHSLRGSHTTASARRGATAALIAGDLAHAEAVSRRHYAQAGAYESGAAGHVAELFNGTNRSANVPQAPPNGHLPSES